MHPVVPHRYGDNSPTSPVSKVFFIFYSLIAVPVIASFAVQTVAAVLSSIAERRVELNRAAREARMLANKAKRLGEGHHDKSHSGHHPHRHGEKGSPPMSKHHRQAHDDKKHRGKESAVEDAEHTDGSDDEEGEFIAHARFVLEHWDTLEEEMSRETKRVDADADDDEADDRRHTEDDDDTSRDDGDRVRRLQDGLAKETLELACKLESQARALLIMALPRSVSSPHDSSSPLPSLSGLICSFFCPVWLSRSLSRRQRWQSANPPPRRPERPAPGCQSSRDLGQGTPQSLGLGTARHVRTHLTLSHADRSVSPVVPVCFVADFPSLPPCPLHPPNPPIRPTVVPAPPKQLNSAPSARTARPSLASSSSAPDSANWTAKIGIASYGPAPCQPEWVRVRARAKKLARPTPTWARRG